MRVLLYKSKALSSSLAIEVHLAPVLDQFRRTLLLLISLASMLLMFNFVLVLIQLEPRLATISSSWGSAAFHQLQLGQSAFTFDVLNTFHLLTLQGKVIAYDFYSALQHKTDNTGISYVKVMGFIVQEPYNWCHISSITIGNSSLLSVNGVILSCLNELDAGMTLQELRKLSLASVL